MSDQEDLRRIYPLWEEEALFARDMQGQLIRTVAATQMDYDADVTLTIDGEKVSIKKAVPMMDSQGNIIKDENGETTPRKTTIYDAATKLYNEKRMRGEWLGREHPIPTLCHREHLTPVGVCRVCAVEVSRLGRDGKETLGRKLLPACHHPVNDTMIVHTLSSTNEEARDRVYRSVRVLTELLTSDHLHEDPEKPDFGQNELRSLRDRLGLKDQRFKSQQPKDRESDLSSFLIQFNRNSCILCNRCVRACNEIKQNHVIGKTGKGYKTKVSFDLDDPMGRSSCVSCGECMITCPTNALTFIRTVESDWRSSLLAQEAYSEVSPEELQQHHLFRDISYKFVQWNEGAIVRWRIKKGEFLFRQGEYGATAFILNSGRFGIWNESRRQNSKAPGGLKFFSRRFSQDTPPSVDELGRPRAILTSEDLIIGEMSCMNSHPRTTTVAALEDGEVFVVRRNILYALQRNSFSRGLLDTVYRERALATHVREVAFFEDLDDDERRECRRFLLPRATFMRVDPGQVIFREGENAEAFFMIRIGHVKVSKMEDGQENVLDYLRPNSSFGEVGLVDPSALDLDVPLERWRRRAATCRALDNVELLRISAASFHELIERFSKLKERFIRWATSYLERERFFTILPRPHRAEFLAQGLFNAQKLLVLDLERCTRCDQCVKACADTHGGVTRLVREGLRLDRYLVASACRSCTDPYCLVGCPVDAIHRNGFTEEIAIESHCIGCGQCANNCPYGNINMHGMPEEREGEVVIQQRATTCDLCTSVVKPGQEVSCVYACPHDAAARISGTELWDRMERESD